MTVFSVPGWLQNAGTVHTAAQMRNYVGALLAGTAVSAVSLRSRGGVHPDIGGELAVTQTGSPSMAVSVDGGAAWISGDEASTQGSYGVFNDGPVVVSITTAHATLPRIDVVQIRVRDSFYSGVNNDALIDVKAGTPNASPTAPTKDANAIELAQVTVGAGVTSIVNANILDRRTYMAGVGGVIKIRNTGARPTSTQIGESQLGYDMLTKELVLWTGAGWETVYQSAPSYSTVEGKDSSVTTGTYVGATYVNTLTTTGIRGVTFIAPPSGKVMVHGMAGAWNNNNNPTYLAFEVRTGGTIGSGTVVLAANDNTASENQGTVNLPFRHKVMGLVTGLTAGTTYNAALAYRGIGGSTSSYNRRHIVVQPLPY